jgi:RHS repeat-associated protein
LAWITNALGGHTRFDVNAFGWITNRVNTLGHVVSLDRDPAGNLLRLVTTRSTSAGLEPLVTRFAYDDAHRPVRLVTPDGATHSTAYNETGLVSLSTDALGRLTRYAYDDSNRLRRVTHPDGTTEEQSYDAEGRVTGYTNALGQATVFCYDPVGRWVATLFPDGSAVSNEFDAAGQLIATIDARGATTRFGYDLVGRVVAVTNALGEVTRYAYDPAGNLTNFTDALGRSTAFSYDAVGQRVRTQFPDGTVSTAVYDVLGRPVVVTDAGGLVTRFGYDPLGRLTGVTNALGHVTRYDYDELGNLTVRTDANGHTTRFDHDAMGRRLRRTLPGGQTEFHAYDGVGALVQHTDCNGYATTYEYDARNRLLARRPDPRRGEPGTLYAYDAAGRRTNMIDAAGVTRYAYDVRQRLVEKVRTWAAVGLTVALHYAHDANGNVTEIRSSDPNGTAVGYEYDALNRLSAVQDPHLGRSAYQYDAVGNLWTWTTPNGLTHACDYDRLNRLTNLFSARLAAPVVGYSYAVGPAGNRLRAREEWFSPLAPVPTGLLDRVYTYDDAYRLTGEQITGGTPSESLSYSYDAAGNRLARHSQLLPQQWFGYDANDRLTTDTYDANGNTLVGRTVPSAPLVSDRYDFENRLITRQTTRNGQPLTVRLAYDGDGQRVGRTVVTPTNAITTCYLVDEQNPTGYAQVLEEHVAQAPGTPTLQAVYSYGHAVLTQDRLTGDASGARTWSASVYGQDAHRNVRYLTDIEGRVTDTYDYDAFGNLIGQSSLSAEPTPNPYRFTGQAYDAELGLYYLRARYHNPDTGRFWTADAFEGFITDPASQHRYSYVQNNPVNWMDPSGHYTLTEAVVATQIASMVNVMAVQGGRDNLARALGVGSDYLHGRAQEVYEALDTVQWALLATDLTAAVQVGRAAPAVLGSVWKMAGGAIAKLSTLTPRQWLGLRLLSPPPTARAAAQAEALLVGGEGVVAAKAGPIRWSPINGPGPVGADVAATFRGGSYTELVTSEATTLYRAYGGEAGQLGRYWTRTPPVGPVQSRIDSALNPAWGNAANSVAAIRVPPGTRIFEGFAAPQGGLLGGGSQVYIQRIDPRWGLNP